MDGAKVVRAALIEAAETLEPLALIESEADDDHDDSEDAPLSWSFAFEDDDLVIVDYAPQDGRVVFTAVLPAPEESRRAEVYELLLQYNAIWQETGGVRMAIEGPGGPVLQIFDMPAHGIRGDDVADVLSGFLRKLPAWSALISEPGTASQSGSGLDGVRV